MRQALAVNQLMKHHVMCWLVKPSKIDHFHKVIWIVVQITSNKKPSSVAKMNACTTPLGIAAKYFRGARQQLRHAKRA